MTDGCDAELTAREYETESRRAVWVMSRGFSAAFIFSHCKNGRIAALKNAAPGTIYGERI